MRRSAYAAFLAQSGKVSKRPTPTWIIPATGHASQSALNLIERSVDNYASTALQHERALAGTGQVGDGLPNGVLRNLSELLMSSYFRRDM